MINLILSLVLAAAPTFAAQADRGFFVEPYVGYMTGSWKCNDTSNCVGTSDSQSVSGMSYGARLGYNNTGFMFGADYASGSYTDSYTNSGSPFTDKFVPGDLGIFAGYDKGKLVRYYFEYFISSTTTDKDTQGGNPFTLTYTGSGGMKVGLGFRVMPQLSINVEFAQESLSKRAVQGATINYSPAYTIGTYGVSISAPHVF